MRTQRQSMHLTLAPTMDCCFNCHYCFEEYKKKGVMSSVIMDNIVKYVSNKKELKKIQLTWFGGEPLMAINQIEQFYDKFKHLITDKTFNSNIITTAYHVDEETVRILKKVGVTSMQITLDGLKETHNSIKNFVGSGDVFEKIMQNIEYLNDNFPELHIVIRVNLTKENSNEYIPLINMLRDRFKGRKKINPAPAFVLDKGLSAGTDKNNTILFNHKERSEFILNLYNKGCNSHFIRYPSRFFNECAIRNDMAISFDPDGYAYKCWEIIGNRKFSIGKLNDDGVLSDINSKMLNRQLFGADPIDDPICQKCKYLPICNGGCPIHRIQNEFEGKNNNTCSYYKGYIEEFLKIHIARKNKEKQREK